AVLGGGLETACLSIPTGSGSYELTIGSTNPSAEDTFGVSLSAASCASGAPSSSSVTTPPVATQEVSAPVVQPTSAGPGPGAGQPGSTACSVSSGASVNIRGGAGTDYDIVGILSPGDSIEAYGQSGTGWYAVRRPGLEGFVSA